MINKFLVVFTVFFGFANLFAKMGEWPNNGADDETTRRAPEATTLAENIAQHISLGGAEPQYFLGDVAAFSIYKIDAETKARFSNFSHYRDDAYCFTCYSANNRTDHIGFPALFFADIAETVARRVIIDTNDTISSLANDTISSLATDVTLDTPISSLAFPPLMPENLEILCRHILVEAVKKGAQTNNLLFRIAGDTTAPTSATAPETTE